MYQVPPICVGPCFHCLDIWSPGLPPGFPDQFYSLSNNPTSAWVLTSQPSYRFPDVWLWQGPCSLYLSSLMCLMQLIIVTSVWGCCRIKQVFTMKVPSTVLEYKSGCFAPCPCSQQNEPWAAHGQRSCRSTPQDALWVSHSGSLCASRGLISPGTGFCR